MPLQEVAPTGATLLTWPSAGPCELDGAVDQAVAARGASWVNGTAPAAASLSKAGHAVDKQQVGMSAASSTASAAGVAKAVLDSVSPILEGPDAQLPLGADSVPTLISEAGHERVVALGSPVAHLHGGHGGALGSNLAAVPLVMPR